jgi:hypothetical protein
LRTIVLDSGAFLALERRDGALFAFLRAARLERAPIIVPASVVAEIWRNPPRHQSTTLIAAAQQIVVLDDRQARAVGALLGVSGTTQIVDAHVCTIAVNLVPSLIVTSDPNDIAVLIAAFDATHGSRGSAAADVIIHAI